jgi:integral membrane protein
MTDSVPAAGPAAPGADARALNRFCWVSLAEGVSFLALGGAMYVKHVAHASAGGPLVMTFGMLHGLLFLAYCALGLEARARARWSLGRSGLALLAAVLPTGALFFERSVRAEQRRLVDDQAGQPSAFATRA